MFKDDYEYSHSKMAIICKKSSKQIYNRGLRCLIFSIDNYEFKRIPKIAKNKHTI